MATTNKPPAPSLANRVWESAVPVALLLVIFLLIWYGAAWAMNSSGAIERVLTPTGNPWTWQDLLSTTLNMERPVVPAPHQVALDFWSSLVDWPVNSPRNLLFHVAVTGETTLVGFVLGTLMGLVLATAIVHSRTLDRALLPWVVLALPWLIAKLRPWLAFADLWRQRLRGSVALVPLLAVLPALGIWVLSFVVSLTAPRAYLVLVPYLLLVRDSRGWAGRWGPPTGC